MKPPIKHQLIGRTGVQTINICKLCKCKKKTIPCDHKCDHISGMERRNNQDKKTQTNDDIQKQKKCACTLICVSCYCEPCIIEFYVNNQQGLFECPDCKQQYTYRVDSNKLSEAIAAATHSGAKNNSNSKREHNHNIHKIGSYFEVTKVKVGGAVAVTNVTLLPPGIHITGNYK